MKTKLQRQTLAAILCLLLSLCAAPAQKSPGTRPAVDPTTGLPVAGGALTIDPTTGLPVAPAPTEASAWIGDSWENASGGDHLKTNVQAVVNYEGLPISEVARDLLARFHNEFDILVPDYWLDRYHPASESMSPGTTTVKLQLKNVTAPEIFNAMNLEFEAENTPVRWELIMNGRRPMAVLRVVPQLLPSTQLPGPEQIMHMVFFVGDLIGDGKHPGLTIDQIVKTVSDVWGMTYGPPEGTIQFHKEAQLIVVKGTQDQIQFVQQTLNGMRQKADLERVRQKTAEPKPKTDEPKPGGGSK